MDKSVFDSIVAAVVTKMTGANVTKETVEATPAVSLWSKIKWWTLCVCVLVTIVVVIYGIYKVYRYFKPIEKPESYRPAIRHSSKFVDPDDVTIEPKMNTHSSTT